VHGARAQYPHFDASLQQLFEIPELQKVCASCEHDVSVHQLKRTAEYDSTEALFDQYR